MILPWGVICGGELIFHSDSAVGRVICGGELIFHSDSAMGSYLWGELMVKIR